MTNLRRCNIGQAGRCNETGCEWKKQFNKDCWSIQQKSAQKELENPLQDAINKLNAKEKKAGIRITDYTKEKSPSRVVKEKKFSEFTNNVYDFLNANPSTSPPKKKKKKKKKINLVSNAFQNILDKRVAKLSDDELFSKIKVAEPEDWLKNIKTI